MLVAGVLTSVVLTAGCTGADSNSTATTSTAPAVPTLATPPAAASEPTTVGMKEPDQTVVPPTTPAPTATTAVTSPTTTTTIAPILAPAALQEVRDALPLVLAATDLIGIVNLDEAEVLAERFCRDLDGSSSSESEGELYFLLRGYVSDLKSDDSTPVSAIMKRLEVELPYTKVADLGLGLMSVACPSILLGLMGATNDLAGDAELSTREALDGFLLAEGLAVALAAGDWTTARQINPRIPYTDAELAEGYEGLEASTLILGGNEWVSENQLALYLLMVAHQSRPSGQQTSIYCVRWDYRSDEQTIEQVAGRLVLQEQGWTPASEAERGAASCVDFDR